jgi:hypothetical protein
MNGQIRRSLLSFSIGLAVVGISSAPVYAQPMPSQDLVRAIRESMVGHSYSKSTYRFGETDLNGDGIKEAIIYVKGPNCGAIRCFYEIFQKQNGKYRSIHGGLIKIFNPQVAVLKSKAGGWSNLAIPAWPTMKKQEGWEVFLPEKIAREKQLYGSVVSTIQPEVTFDFYKMKEFNLADDGVPEVATSQSKGVSKTIQDLPDGNYFYGADPSSYKAGVDYLVFKKAGRTLVGVQYHAGSGSNSCFIGEIQADKVVNATEAYSVPGDNRDLPSQWEFLDKQTVNFHSINTGKSDVKYNIGFEKAPDFANRSYKKCLSVLADRVVATKPQKPTPSNSPPLSTPSKFPT